MTEGLDRDASPPRALKDRVIQSLRADGVLSPAKSDRRWQYVALAAAVVIGFGFGYVANETNSEPGQLVTGERYALLLYTDSAFRPKGSSAELVAEYAAWARSLRSRKQLALGEKLSDSGRVVSSRGAVAEGVESAGSISGFFIVSAADIAEAVALASTCPHVLHGGRIVVRPIEAT